MVDSEKKLHLEELLEHVCFVFTQNEVAVRLGVSREQVNRWLKGKQQIPPHYESQMMEMLPSKPEHYGGADFKFIDLFAGIGGIRKGFEEVGGECVFTSEWDRHAQRTYFANHYMGSEGIAGDITRVDPHSIPDHDVLLAGFPCQPFSLAGVSKKNSLGRAHGFECKTQGTLFFNVAKILETKHPSAFLLENVKNLRSHDKGHTFRIIMETLDELGYEFVEDRVIDARHYVPQHRERVFIVGFRRDTGFRWEDLVPPANGPRMASILEPEASVDPKYILSQKLWRYLQNYAKKHQEKGNGFGFGMVGPNDVARTLSARYHKDGSEILISRGRKNPRRLTPNECARLMGYSHRGRDDFKIPVSDTQAYRQFGNSVVVPVIQEIAKMMRPHILSNIDLTEGNLVQMKLSA